MLTGTQQIEVARAQEQRNAIAKAVAAERARCVQAIKDCPSLDENGYVCQKADAISEILKGL